MSWAVKLAGSFAPYDVGTTCCIEDAFQRNETEAHVTLRGMEYRIDFATMRQINRKDSSKQRAVQRTPAATLAAPSPAPGPAPAAPSSVAASPSPAAGSTSSKRSADKRSADNDVGADAKRPRASPTPVVIATWNAQSLQPGTDNKNKLPRLLPRLPLQPDLLFIQETQLVSAAAQKKLPAAQALLPGFTFHTVPVAADAASDNAAKGTGVYVRDASPLAAGGALEVDLAADPWGAIAVWRCDRGVIIGGRLPVPRAVDVATRRRLEDHLESLLRAHGARVLAVVGDLNTTPDLALDATVPWTGAAYAASRARLAGLMRSFSLRDVWRKAHPTERRWTTYQEREGRAWQARCDLVLVPEAHATHAEATIVDGPGFVNSEGTKSSGKELAGSDHVPVLLAMRL